MQDLDGRLQSIDLAQEPIPKKTRRTRQLWVLPNEILVLGFRLGYSKQNKPLQLLRQETFYLQLLDLVIQQPSWWRHTCVGCETRIHIASRVAKKTTAEDVHISLQDMLSSSVVSHVQIRLRALHKFSSHAGQPGQEQGGLRGMRVHGHLSFNCCQC